MKLQSVLSTFWSSRHQTMRRVHTAEKRQVAAEKRLRDFEEDLLYATGFAKSKEEHDEEG